jgi:hypothetical protein
MPRIPSSSVCLPASLKSQAERKAFESPCLVRCIFTSLHPRPLDYAKRVFFSAGYTMIYNVCSMLTKQCGEMGASSLHCFALPGWQASLIYASSKQPGALEVCRALNFVSTGGDAVSSARAFGPGDHHR